MKLRFRVLALVMAAGKGERLLPLTAHRSKPAVPFGGKFRIIDFVLSNLTNSGIHSIYVLTQFKSQSLLEHLRYVWSLPSLHRDDFVVPLPAQMRKGESWYRGTADAIYQNIERIEEHRPDVVAVFAGDHVYKMDVAQMIAFHRRRESDLTVAVVPFPRSDAGRFGVVEVNDDWEVIGFQEKPADPKPMPGRDEMSLVSMGNYLFATDALTQELRSGEGEEAGCDFGKDVIPKMIGRARLLAYDFTSNRIPGSPRKQPNTYWRDIGTVDAFYEANMDLRSMPPALNLHDDDWPIRSQTSPSGPAKFAYDGKGRTGQARNSLVCDGTIVTGGLVQNSIVGFNVRVRSRADVDESILMDRVVIGAGAKVRRAIIDKFVEVPPGSRIGFDLERDRAEYTVTQGGVVIVPRRATRREVSEISV